MISCFVCVYICAMLGKRSKVGHKWWPLHVYVISLYFLIPSPFPGLSHTVFCTLHLAPDKITHSCLACINYENLSSRKKKEIDLVLKCFRGSGGKNTLYFLMLQKKKTNLNHHHESMGQRK